MAVWSFCPVSLTQRPVPHSAFAAHRQAVCVPLTTGVGVSVVGQEYVVPDCVHDDGISPPVIWQ